MTIRLPGIGGASLSAKQTARLMKLAVGWMLVAGVVFLVYEYWRALFQTHWMGAVDLYWYNKWAHDWFAGRPVYDGQLGAEYPPASFVLLWPLAGWLDFAAARWLWAAMSVLAIAGLMRMAVRESGAETRLERIFIALVPFSMYATGAAVGNGQLIIYILPALVGACLLLRRAPPGWPRDLLVAALYLFALVKPSLSPPFFWIIVFAAGSLRPGVLAALGYVALTLFASIFQGMRPLAHFRAAMANGVGDIGEMGETMSLFNLMAAQGIPDLMIPAALVVVALLGVWVYARRTADVWLLMGVSASVARFWARHRWYDDLLFLLPMIALFRLAKGGDTRAGTLFALMIPAMIAPGGQYLFPPPWNEVYLIAQAALWFAVTIFLVIRAQPERDAVPALTARQAS
jgi:hypothetical protein